MAKGLRAFFRRRKQKDSASTLPPSVAIPLPDGRSLEVDTAPLGAASANFRTHRIVLNSPAALEVAPSLALRILAGAFALLGFVVLVLASPSLLRTAEKTVVDAVGIVLAVLLCLAFVVFGVAGMTGWLGIPMAVMDRRVGLYWKRRIPRAIRAWARPPLSLENIAAVQMCSKRVRSQNGSYTTYEINLVMSEPPGERICLMSHGKKKAIRSDAQQTADFLQCPLLEHI